MILKYKSFCSLWLPELLLAALLLPLLAGCSKGTQSTNPLRIGVALYSKEDTFISSVARAVERTALETEQETREKINISLADGRSNQTTQLNQIDHMLDRGCDVLCVNIVDRTAAAVIIDKAQEAQVPVIFFNRQPVAEDIQRWDQVFYVGADGMESGLLQGRIVLSAWLTRRDQVDRNGDGALQYVMLEGEPGHQDALLRSEYATKPLLDARIHVDRLDSATANWSRAQASARTLQMLREFGTEIEVIFANNDDMALGALDACQEMELEVLPIIVGVDGTKAALDAMEAGTMAGTVCNDSEGIAQAMVQLARTLHSGGEPAQAVDLTDGHYVWLPYTQITRRNLEEFRK